uniref:Uncharacterized protein n=1 Tax=Nelumbo nucifera TaxID=4432 RepID=A0A822YNV6_NELNU|nr:TPA_asm: hypothetical protein HUJ06_004930 [Nelumbo nucifera]
MSFYDRSATTSFHCSSFVVEDNDSDDPGLFLIKDKKIDLKRPLELAFGCLLESLMSIGTTEIFSREVGRHLLQDTKRSSSSLVFGHFQDDSYGRLGFDCYSSDGDAPLLLSSSLRRKTNVIKVTN